MILDAELFFDDSVEHLTTEASSNVIAFGSPRNIGVGEELYLGVIVTEAFTDTGSDSTMTVSLETDDNEAMASPLVAQTIGTFGALSAVGSKLFAKIAPDALNQAFAQLRYTVANGDLSTGKFKAFITKDIDAVTAYPTGFTVQ